MSLSQGFVDLSASAVGGAVDAVVHRLASGQVRDEEDFTSRMLESIESGVDGLSVDGVTWRATVTKRQTEEPALGADFLATLMVHTQDYTVEKGFLAQAKMVGRGTIRRKRVLKQANDMLAVTPAAFFFLYRPAGVRIAPALAVRAAGGSPTAVRSWSVLDFFRGHFESFLGDRRLAVGPSDLYSSVLEANPPSQVLELRAVEGASHRESV